MGQLHRHGSFWKRKDEGILAQIRQFNRNWWKSAVNVLYFTEVFVYSGFKKERRKKAGEGRRKEEMEGERMSRLLL